LHHKHQTQSWIKQFWLQIVEFQHLMSDRQFATIHAT
jgi:hypothetical protein